MVISTTYEYDQVTMVTKIRIVGVDFFLMFTISSEDLAQAKFPADVWRNNMELAAERWNSACPENRIKAVPPGTIGNPFWIFTEDNEEE